MSCKFFSISTYDYIRNTCLHYIDELELVLCHPMLYILHDESHPTKLSITDPMPMSFSHITLCLVTLPLLLLQLLQNCYYHFCHCYCYFHTTLLLNTLLQILSYLGVIELTTQLLILENILWLPLCRINKFGMNTLPLKNVVIPYTCRLSRLFSGAVAGEHSSILWVTWDLYLLITMKNLKYARPQDLRLRDPRCPATW